MDIGEYYAIKDQLDRIEDMLKFIMNSFVIAGLKEETTDRSQMEDCVIDTIECLADESAVILEHYIDEHFEDEEEED